MRNSSLLIVIAVVTTSYIPCLILYERCIQKKRSKKCTAVLEGLADLFTWADYRNISSFVKKILQILNAQVVFVADYRNSNTVVDIRGEIGNGAISKVVAIDLQGTSLDQTLVNPPCRMNTQQDSEFLKSFNLTGRPFVQTMPLIMSKGSVIGFVGVIYNKRPSDDSFVKQVLRFCTTWIITARERLENELKTGYRQEQAFRARKMDSMSMLARNFAHDMNNQLNAILGYSDLLSKKLPQDPHLKKFLDGMISSAKSGVDLTDKLMAFARKGKNLSIMVDINSLIKETIPDIRLSDSNAACTISTHLNAVDSTVIGDPALLKNMLTSLILNAFDSMPQGGILSLITENVILSSHDSSISESYIEIPEGKYLTISVRDTGKGINESIKDHLFEPFITTKNNRKRTGLGLATVWGCVKNHNGYIDVNSDPGAGSIFTVYLPGPQA